MGIFSFIKDAAQEVNDEVHGSRLLNEVQSTFIAMESLEPKQLYVAMSGYLKVRQNILKGMIGLSKEDLIKQAD